MLRFALPGDEMEEKQQLEEQLRAVMDKFKYKRRQIRELQDDLQTMGHTLDNLSRDEDAYVEMIQEKQVHMYHYQYYYIPEKSPYTLPLKR